MSFEQTSLVATKQDDGGNRGNGKQGSQQIGSKAAAGLSLAMRELESYDALSSTSEPASGSATGQRRTKIACKVGPTNWDVTAITDLLTMGMDTACLDLSSHHEHDELLNALENLREVLREPRFKGRHITLMCETKGPVITVGEIGTPSKRLRLMRGQTLEIVPQSGVVGNLERIGCNYAALGSSLEPGGKIFVSAAGDVNAPSHEFNEALAAGGVVALTVLEILPTSITVRVDNGGVISQFARMRLPGCAVDLPTLTTKDTFDIEQFVVPQTIDCLALSFVRDASCVRQAREQLGEDGPFVKVIAKIETQEAVDNFWDIIREADGAILCRRSLSLELSHRHTHLAFVQKLLSTQARVVGKPFWVSTDVSESIVPHRAESTDVANMILDGADAMFVANELSDDYYRSVIMKNLVETTLGAEALVDPRETFNRLRAAAIKEFGVLSTDESLACAAVQCSLDIGAQAVIVISDDFDHARLIVKYRPACHIIAVTANDWAARQISGCLRGACSVLVESLEGADAIAFEGINFGHKSGLLKEGGSVICARFDNSGLQVMDC